MKSTRSMVVGLGAVLVLGLSGTAFAAVQPATSVSQVQHPTTIRYLPFQHIQAATHTVVIRGQVAAHADGERGALGGVQVKLYRQLDGNAHWVFVAAQPTGNAAFPHFAFATPARQNAHYKVVFTGNSNFRGSEDTTWVSVYRSFNGRITDGQGSATLRGDVTPYYTHKPIWLQKRSCAACGYVTIKKVDTGVGGAYSFSLPAPPHGRWWWRLVIPGTGAYIASYGGTFTTATT
jgi:hypothetical protein